MGKNKDCYNKPVKSGFVYIDIFSIHNFGLNGIFFILLCLGITDMYYAYLHTNWNQWPWRKCDKYLLFNNDNLKQYNTAF